MRYIFSLVKGGKEHGVFEMRMFDGEVLNSYEKGGAPVWARMPGRSFLLYRNFFL